MAVQGTQSTGIDASLSTLSTNVITVRRCRVLGEPVDRVPAPAVTAIASAGISLRFGMACLVEDCVVANVAGDGIAILTANAGDTTTSGIIRGCVISRCGGHGIALAFNASVPKGLLLERCTIDQCGVDGVNILCPVRVVDCVSKSNTGEGFQLSSQASISGCLAEGNGGDGIQITGDRCHLTNNTCASNTVAGIHLGTAANACRIDEQPRHRQRARLFHRGQRQPDHPQQRARRDRGELRHRRRQPRRRARHQPRRGLREHQPVGEFFLLNPQLEVPET